jgi:hypothetical protein
MAREWRLVLRPTGALSAEALERELARHDPPFDVESDAGDVLCYVSRPDSVVRTRRVLRHALVELGCDDLVVQPIHAERWSERRHLYVDNRAGPYDPARGEDPWDRAAIDRNEIRWLVKVVPATVFDVHEVVELVGHHGRPPVGGSPNGIEVGARDEADAKALAAELAAEPEVAHAYVRRLGRYEGWLLRRRLLGGYDETADPTLPR